MYLPSGANEDATRGALICALHQVSNERIQGIVFNLSLRKLRMLFETRYTRIGHGFAA